MYTKALFVGLFSYDVLSFKTKMLPSFLFFFSRRESRERADVICWLAYSQEGKQGWAGGRLNL